MLLVDRKKMRAIIAGERMKVSEIIAKFGISRTAYYNKLNGKASFNENELCILKDIFGDEIFFK